MIKLLLADDHKIITDGISNLLIDEKDIEVVEVCQDGTEVLEKLGTITIDLILLDIDMPKMNGMECAAKVLAQRPDTKIAMLTMHREKSLIQKFIEMGVKGYFLKTIAKDELIHAIKTIANGGEYFPSDVTKALIEKQKLTPSITQSPLLAELSTREIEIIKLIAQGLSNKEVAEKLFISPKTSDTHRTNLMQKLDIHNVAGLVRFAFQNKLVE